MTKFYAQEKRVFDLNKVTVVGSPSISEDGVASGFSKGSNYITASLNISNYNTLVIQNKFNYKVNTNESGATYWLNGIKFRNLVSSSGVLQFYTEEESNYYSVAYPANNFKDGDVVETRVTLTNSLINTEVWVNGIALTPKQFSNVVSLANITSVGLGSSYYQGNNPFQGSIDLTAFKIYADGKLVHSPTKPVYFLERRKEGFDLSKFTVVGSPTITEAGVASGLTTNNYVTFNSVIDTNKTFNFKGSFVYKKATVSQNIFHSFATTGGQLSGGCRILLNPAGNLVLWAYTGTVDGRAVLSANNFADGDNIDFDFSFSNEKRELKVSKDGGLNWITGQNTTLLNFTGKWQGFTVGLEGYAGSIDLPSISITVDGKEVFTGAKEKFYAMQGGM